MIMKCDLCRSLIDSDEYEKKHKKTLDEYLLRRTVPILCDGCLDAIHKTYFDEEFMRKYGAKIDDVEVSIVMPDNCITEDILKQLADLRAQVSEISLELEIARMCTLIANC